MNDKRISAYWGTTHLDSMSAASALSSTAALKKLNNWFFTRRYRQAMLIIGGGSNLLLKEDYPATVIHSAIRGIEVLDKAEGLVRCGSGEVWDDIVDWSIRHNLYGAENLSIIPGEVGASAVQNIGAYGAEVKDLIYDVECVEIETGKLCHFSNEDCQYSYRQSRFKRIGATNTLLPTSHINFSLPSNLSSTMATYELPSPNKESMPLQLRT